MWKPVSSTLTSENLKVKNKIKSDSQIFQTNYKLGQEFRIFCYIKIISDFEGYVISGLCSMGFFHHFKDNPFYYLNKFFRLLWKFFS